MALINQKRVNNIPEQEIKGLCNALEEALDRRVEDTSFLCNSFRDSQNIHLNIFDCSCCLIKEDYCGIYNPRPDSNKKKRTLLWLLINRLRSRLKNLEET